MKKRLLILLMLTMTVSSLTGCKSKDTGVLIDANDAGLDTSKNTQTTTDEEVESTDEKAEEVEELEEGVEKKTPNNILGDWYSEESGYMYEFDNGKFNRFNTNDSNDCTFGYYEVNDDKTEITLYTQELVTEKLKDSSNNSEEKETDSEKKEASTKKDEVDLNNIDSKKDLDKLTDEQKKESSEIYNKLKEEEESLTEEEKKEKKKAEKKKKKAEKEGTYKEYESKEDMLEDYGDIEVTKTVYNKETYTIKLYSETDDIKGELFKLKITKGNKTIVDLIKIKDIDKSDTPYEVPEEAKKSSK